ncbi:MAG TPA: triose-phosphate isomerase [Gemmatimonadaceae bacterium]|nr:triose-phosphate isomerase [Gemmatimonadaceae bacterium]
MRTPIFAANWKMNLGPPEAGEFVRTFLKRYQPRAERTVIFFPPAVSLTTVVAALRERSELLVGVQNVHSEEAGAFTGETSAPMARDAGARLVLVGHSERRHVFGERDEQTAAKCAVARRAGLTVMLCVGETLEERERGDTDSVVLRQLGAGLARLSATDAQHTLIAYEPVWAIGTGRTAQPTDASAVHAVLRAALRDAYGEAAAAIRILYGGSVKRDNARSLLTAPHVDGLLVGGASIDPGGWASLIDA